MTNGRDQATLAAQIYERIRRGILNGELQPGQPMSRRRIATELRTSPLPVASAFQRLEIEGLLESRPRAGTRVRALSLDEIRGHFVVREALETQAATRVALLATPLELTHLDTLARELDMSEHTGRCEAVLHPAPGISPPDRCIQPMRCALRCGRSVPWVLHALALAGLAPV